MRVIVVHCADITACGMAPKGATIGATPLRFAATLLSGDSYPTRNSVEAYSRSPVISQLVGPVSASGCQTQSGSAIIYSILDYSKLAFTLVVHDA
jgi:hypothetical protein